MNTASPAASSLQPALVTGAGRGIGRACAVVLAALGHPLVLTARTKSQLQETMAECALARKQSGTPALTDHLLVADVADPAACERMAHDASNLAGHIGILINAAGIALAEPIHKATADVFARQIAVNLTAPYLLIRALAPGMRERKSGRIVNIASVAGLRGYPYVTAYCASKHGLIGLTRAAAKELAPFGVTVNAVCPGYVDTPMTDASVASIAAKTGKSEPEARATLAALSPQNRLFSVDEVAAAVAYLVSDGARGVNGQCLTICGGETA